MRLVLASASPARLATLRAAGLDPEVVVSGVDESTFASTAPTILTVEIATAKARAVAATPVGAQADLVIGCDSMLALDGEILGKPRDAADATRRWQSMRGRSGILVTGHCLIVPASGRTVTAAAETVVEFANVDDAEIAAYVETQEPLAVAGAFTIDGLGGAFVTRIAGDHHNVVGISLPLLRNLVRELGWSWPQLWTRA